MSIRCRLGYHAWEYGTVHGTLADAFDIIPVNLRICRLCHKREEKRIEGQERWAKWMAVLPVSDDSVKP